MSPILVILSANDSYSLVNMVFAGGICFAAALLFKFAKLRIAQKRILRLEDEMLANHARILKLQKKLAEFQNDNFILSGSQKGTGQLKKVEELQRKVS